MLLSEEFKPFDDKNFIYELKFDGIRSLIHIKNGEITIQNTLELRPGWITRLEFPWHVRFTLALKKEIELLKWNHTDFIPNIDLIIIQLET